MPVKINGLTSGSVTLSAPATGSDVSLSLPGSAGTLATQEYANSVLSLGGRNIVYNGAMQITQRGTSTSGITGGGYYTADRWFFGNNALGTWTQTVENDAPAASGLRKSLKVLCTTADASPAAGDYLQIQQYFEGQDLQRTLKGTESARSMTVSFWVKSNVTGTYIVALTDSDNSRYIASSYTISASGVWERKVITFVGDTSGVFDNDNALSLQLTFWLASGSTYTSGALQTSWGTVVNANLAPGQLNLGAATNNYWQVTGVQLELGSVASSFEFKSIGQDLAECQRYYWRPQFRSLYASYGTGRASSTTVASIMVYLPVTMRAVPTLLEFFTLGLHIPTVSIAAVTALVPAGTTESVMEIQTTVASGLTAGTFYYLSNNNSTSGYLGLGAEL